jgi:hypothetical protein
MNEVMPSVDVQCVVIPSGIMISFAIKHIMMNIVLLNVPINPIMLNVIMNEVIPSVVVQSVIILNVIMLSYAIINWDNQPNNIQQSIMCPNKL